MNSDKILSRDRECCRQLQSPGQILPINIFNLNPNKLHVGNRSDEFKCFNEYPPNQKRNPRRSNPFGTWHSYKLEEEIKDAQGRNIVGYKQQFYFKDKRGKPTGLGMREYTLYKRGANDISFCVIYKTKKYSKWGDTERQPNEEHRSYLASTPVQAQSPTVAQRRESTTPSASEDTDLSSKTLPSDENPSMVETPFPEDPESMPENDDYNRSTYEDNFDDVISSYFPEDHDHQNDLNSIFQHRM